MRHYQAECVLPVRATLGEGPFWDGRSETLYFVDIKGRGVHAFDTATGRHRHYAFPDYVCWLVPRRDGDGFVAGMRRGLARVWFDPLRVQPLDVALDLAPGVRLNDAKVHPDGSLWFGSMHDSEPQRPDGTLYRLTPLLGLSVQDHGLNICNGPAFSADGKRMFHNDSLRGRTHLHYLNEGQAGPGALWRQAGGGDGSPDGMCFDSEGALWIAFWGAGQVRRYRPDGQCDAVVQVPASQTSSVAFGGADLRTLYITTAAEDVAGREPLAGALFAARVDVPGLTPHCFG